MTNRTMVASFKDGVKSWVTKGQRFSNVKNPHSELHCLAIEAPAMWVKAAQIQGPKGLAKKRVSSLFWGVSWAVSYTWREFLKLSAWLVQWPSLAFCGKLFFPQNSVSHS